MLFRSVRGEYESAFLVGAATAMGFLREREGDGGRGKGKMTVLWLLGVSGVKWGGLRAASRRVRADANPA